MYQPDYSTLRAQTKVTWHVGVGHSALLEVAQIPVRDYFLNLDVGIDAYTRR